ncbi:MAG: glycosyltransferase family 4 protein [Polyangiaceae bacterium]
MTKVAHVVVAGEIGGAERMLCDLASRPKDTKAEHVIALMTPNEALLQLFVKAGLRVHDRGRVREDPAAFLWRSLGPLDTSWLEGVLREERADVIHLHTFGSQMIGTRAAKRVKARIVRTEHSTRVYDDPSCWPFSRWSLRRTDACIAISEHVRAVAISKASWIASKTRVIHNGVDTAHFTPRSVTLPEAFTFVIVARLEARKGVDLAIEALREIPDAHLEVIGEGDERASLDSLVSSNGMTERVRFHGQLEDTRPIVAGCHAALSSSRKEGLGNANLEAMAMARAVVSFPVGGVPEIVADEETGFISREMTVRSLAERMRDAMGDRERTASLGEAARAFVVERCSIEAMCRAYGDVYAPP